MRRRSDITGLAPDGKRPKVAIADVPEQNEIQEDSTIIQRGHADAPGGISANQIDSIQLSNLIQCNNIYMITGQSDAEREEDKRKYTEQFIIEVNKRSATEARCNIAGNFHGYDVQEPETEVAPTLVKTNFYRGDTALDEKDYTATLERGRGVLKKKSREVKVELCDVHRMGRIIALVGGAGSGKTTLIKRYTSMVLNKKVKGNEQLNDVKVTHLVNVRDLSNRKLTLREMLFGKLLPGEQLKKAVQYGFEWMQDRNNQPLILLAFDGIDTAPWTLTEDSHEKISYDDVADAETIMYNILLGHLFPECWILLTSREYGITKFPSGIRPDSVIALKGLSRSSIETLVKELGGSQGDAIWESLLKKSRNLMLLCSNPLFLVFTVIVYRQNPTNHPESLSGIIITLLESHIHSEHSRVKDIRSIIRKLMKLSWQALLEGKVVFSSQQVEKVGLQVGDVKDLVISVPTPSTDGVYRQRVIEEECSMFFCHQALQECLAALYVAEKPINSFVKFVQEYLHKPKYVVVRQFLHGILFNDETSELVEKQSRISAKEKKRSCLLETLKGELESKMESPMDMLGLLISLRECGEEKNVADMIRGTISKICLSGIPLTPSDLHAAASVARHCDKLSIMQLVNCHLDDSGLEVLANGMKGSNVEITVFDVSFNSNLRKDSMANLYEICRRGQGLNYWQCGFRQADILDFNTKDAKKISVVKELTEEERIVHEFTVDHVLDLSCHNLKRYFMRITSLIKDQTSQDTAKRIFLSEYEESSDVTRLCQVLRECANIKALGITQCEFSPSQLQSIESALGDKEVGELNVFLNPAITEKGWEILGRIVATNKVRLLHITACSPTEAKLRSFQRQLGTSKIHKLDISRNDDMDEYCLQIIGEIVEEHGVQEFVMGYCKFTSENMKRLKISLGKSKINRLDMSGNDKMGVAGFQALGDIVNKCEVEQLDISECDPSPSEISSFREAVDKAKIKRLNVSRNRNMQESGLEDVGKLAGQCCVEDLFVRQCGLEVNTLASLKRGMGDSKINWLDLGYYFMKERHTTSEEIQVIEEILSNVNGLLTLNDWDISGKDRRSLQAALDRQPHKGVRIELNRGKKEFLKQKS